MKNSLILLDRDGVVNSLVYRPGDNPSNLDSPKTLLEINIFPWVYESLLKLRQLNYEIVIVTNQPSAAKGTISLNDLKNIHNYIINFLKNEDIILDSFICFHKKEDNCLCRKPKPGMLEEAFKKYPKFNKLNSWMVGDRATDIIAGNTFGVKTALLGPSVLSDLELLNSLNIKPNYLGNDLRDFIKELF